MTKPGAGPASNEGRADRGLQRVAVRPGRRRGELGLRGRRFDAGGERRRRENGGKPRDIHHGPHRHGSPGHSPDTDSRTRVRAPSEAATGACATSWSTNRNGIQLRDRRAGAAGRLLDLAARQHADKAVLGLHALHVDLRGEHVAADLGHRVGDALQQRRARDGEGLAFEERRAGGQLRRRAAGGARGLRPSSCASRSEAAAIARRVENIRRRRSTSSTISAATAAA